MRALGYVNRFGMGIGLVADELKANGNPPAEYVFSEPSSFKVIVRSADPHVHSSETHDSQGGTHVETHVGTQDCDFYKKLHYFQCKVLQCSPNSAKYNLLTLSASFLVGFIERLYFSFQTFDKSVKILEYMKIERPVY
jgi:hypothetical protein